MPTVWMPESMGCVDLKLAVTLMPFTHVIALAEEIASQWIKYAAGTAQSFENFASRKIFPRFSSCQRIQGPSFTGAMPIHPMWVTIISQQMQRCALMQKFRASMVRDGEPGINASGQ